MFRQELSCSFAEGHQSLFASGKCKTHIYVVKTENRGHREICSWEVEPSFPREIARVFLSEETRAAIGDGYKKEEVYPLKPLHKEPITIANSPGFGRVAFKSTVILPLPGILNCPHTHRAIITVIVLVPSLGGSRNFKIWWSMEVFRACEGLPLNGIVRHVLPASLFNS